MIVFRKKANEIQNEISKFFKPKDVIAVYDFKKV